MLNALTVVSCSGALKNYLELTLHNDFDVLTLFNVLTGGMGVAIDFLKSEGILYKDRSPLDWVTLKLRLVNT